MKEGEDDMTEAYASEQDMYAARIAEVRRIQGCREVSRETHRMTHEEALSTRESGGDMPTRERVAQVSPAGAYGWLSTESTLGEAFEASTSLATCTCRTN